MRKSIFVVVFIMIFGASSYAQAQFGLKAGMNIANVTGEEEVENLDSRLGLVFGAFVNIPLTESVSFQPEFLYSMKGAKAEESGTMDGASFDGDVVSKFDYLDVPMMLKYHVGNGVNFQAGPQVGFLLSAEETYDLNFSEDGTSFSISETEDLMEYMKKVEFGFNFGLGYDFDFGLGFDVRYNLGLSNIIDEESVTLKNRVVQLTASYLF